MSKRCAACGEVGSRDDFYAHPSTTDGLMGVCKACHRAAVKRRRRLNPSVQAYDRERSKMPGRRKRAIQTAKLWRRNHPEAYRAQTAVGNALRDGKLVREPCLFCRTTEHVHAHHRDYTKPLEVMWLCASCHHRLHAAFPEIEGHQEKSA